MEVSHKPHLHQDWIDPHAFGIVKALQRAGFETYLVGGCVRDLLLGLHPKDYDIATLAQPKEIKNLIYNSYIIGRRFLLVLAKREAQQFEIATFRRETKVEDIVEGETPLGDNAFGSPEEDARRRDFTINALFYDPINDDLIDYVDAMKDVKNRTLRMIGEPDVRLTEDPIRILRALRFAHKLELNLEENLRASMQRNAASVALSVLPRRREEILKILRLHEPYLAFLEAYDLGVLEHLSPYLFRIFSDDVIREKFAFYLNQFKELCVTMYQPQHLLSWLVLSSLYATCEGDWPRTDEIKSEHLQEYMRNELGMFKLEQGFFNHTLQLSHMMQKTALLKRRGPKRLLSLFKNESFEFCLKLIEVNYELPAQDILFWRNAFQDLSPELRRQERPTRPPRRRRKKPEAPPLP